MTDYNYKLDKFLIPRIKNKMNPIIIEFGVQNGRSTKKFLEICEKNNGYLYSFDIIDCSQVSNSEKWTFAKSRDDNFEYLKTIIPKKVDLIFLDTVHEANHVEKMIYYYYDYLTEGGYFIIDDISHLPYLKNQKRNNFYCEINNSETLKKILEIYNSNTENFDLAISFISSGLASLEKKNKNKLNKSNKIITREYSFKNILRKIIKEQK